MSSQMKHLFSKQGMNWTWVQAVSMFAWIVFLGTCVQAEGVHVASSTGQWHVLRNFERLLLSSGEKVLPRDLLVVEKGPLKLKVSHGLVWLGSGSKLKISELQGALNVDLIAGELLFDLTSHWTMASGLGTLKGSKASLFIHGNEEALEVSCLEGEVKWKHAKANHWLSLDSMKQFYLTDQQRQPQYPRRLSALDVQVYRSWFGDTTASKDALVGLEGLPYDPRGEMGVLEAERRRVLDHRQDLLNQRSTTVRQLKAKAHREFLLQQRESIQEVDGFEFPKPLAPPPK